MLLRARTDAAKDVRRQAFLDAALVEFFEHGFAASRMDDIARRARLSKGTLYLYFDSKHDLFTGLVDALAIPNVEHFERIAEDVDDAPTAIRVLLQAAAHMVRESPLPRVVKVLIAEAGVFPELVQSYRHQVVERVLRAITKILEGGHERGELTVPDPALTARIVVAPVIFSALWKVIFETDGDEPVDLDALFALHADTLLEGLSAGETTQ